MPWRDVRGWAGPTSSGCCGCPYLAPAIVEAILAGREPDGLTVNALMKAIQLPLAWDEQRRLLGFR